MKFELGKYYQHTTGCKLHICGIADTRIYGICFVGESDLGTLYHIGSEEEKAVNHAEITKEEFLYRNKGVDRNE